MINAKLMDYLRFGKAQAGLICLPTVFSVRSHNPGYDVYPWRHPIPHPPGLEPLILYTTHGWHSCPSGQVCFRKDFRAAPRKYQLDVEIVKKWPGARFSKVR